MLLIIWYIWAASYGIDSVGDLDPLELMGLHRLNFCMCKNVIRFLSESYQAFCQAVIHMTTSASGRIRVGHASDDVKSSNWSQTLERNEAIAVANYAVLANSFRRKFFAFSHLSNAATFGLHSPFRVRYLNNYPVYVSRDRDVSRRMAHEGIIVQTQTQTHAHARTHTPI